MIDVLHAEFRKFFTVRSTYIVSILALVLAGFIAFWGSGYKGGPTYASDTLQSSALSSISIVAIFVGILAILLICHEYRYNTIGYTLTASNSRLKVFIAKFIILGAYALVISLVTVAMAVGLTTLGAQTAGHHMSTQTIDGFSLLWRAIVFMVGSAWMGLILGFLSRSLVFAIVAYFVIPTVEPILHLLLKVNNNYLPTTAQGYILQSSPSPDIFSPLAALGIFSIYLGGAAIVALVLFLRKDAN